MSRVLFSTGAKVHITGGKVQIIPSGSTAADCLCCDGGGGGDCSFCDGIGSGPYTSMQHDLTISGFPATFEYANGVRFCGGGPGNIRKYTVTGLDNANGTYTLNTDDVNCLFTTDSTDITADIVDERLDPAFGETDACNYSVVVSTTTRTDGWRLSYGTGSWTLSFKGAALPCLPSFSGTANQCLGGGGSTLVSGGFCSNFTYTWNYVITV